MDSRVKSKIKKRRETQIEAVESAAPVCAAEPSTEPSCDDAGCPVCGKPMSAAKTIRLFARRRPSSGSTDVQTMIDLRPSAPDLAARSAMTSRWLNHGWAAGEILEDGVKCARLECSTRLKAILDYVSRAVPDVEDIRFRDSLAFYEGRLYALAGCRFSKKMMPTCTSTTGVRCALFSRCQWNDSDSTSKQSLPCKGETRVFLNLTPVEVADLQRMHNRMADMIRAHEASIASGQEKAADPAGPADQEECE